MELPDESALSLARQIGEGGNVCGVLGHHKVRDCGYSQGIVVKLRFRTGWHGGIQVVEKSVPDGRGKPRVLNQLERIADKHSHLVLAKIRPFRLGVRTRDKW